MFDEYSAEWLRNLADGGCAVCQRPLSADGIAELVHGKPICAQCAARADEYGARREERLMYLEERAARKAQQAHELWERGHEMASVIPFGQPMMPGHHSYARDRRYRARIHRTFERAYEETMDAKRARERAEAAAGNRTIATEDPLAVVKLEEKLAEAERFQERMKAANKAIRRAKGDEQAAIKNLAELGYTEAQARSLLHPKWGGRPGYQDYELRNNSANIRRMKKRLEALRERARRVAESDGPETQRADDAYPGLVIERDVADNRLRLLFDGKPPEAVRAVLKRYGWRWSRANRAWQRHLTGNGEAALHWTLEGLRGLRAAPRQADE